MPIRSTQRVGRKSYLWPIAILAVVLVLIGASCSGDDGGAGADIISERGLTDEQVEAALKTWLP